MSANEDELPDPIDQEGLVEPGEGYEDLREIYQSVKDWKDYNEDPSAATYESPEEFVNAIQELVPGEIDEARVLEEHGRQLDADSLKHFEHENLPVDVIYDPGNSEAYIQFDRSGEM